MAWQARSRSSVRIHSQLQGGEFYVPLRLQKGVKLQSVTLRVVTDDDANARASLLQWPVHAA